MFLAVIDAVVPVFGLILLGWLAAHRQWLPDSATDALNRFVIFLALPALLFMAMARSDVSVLSEFGLSASFGLGTLGASLIYLWVSRRESLDTVIRSINSMSASYANAGFMGIPLILIVFGQQAMPAAVVVCIMTVAVLFGLTIVAIEIFTAKGGELAPALKRVGLSLAKNPILVAPVAGLLFSAYNIPIPTAAEGLIDLLAGAATPCALITIGLFLARSPAASSSRSVPQIVWIKLLVHPVLVGLFALMVFDVDPVWAWTAILAAALPVGTGPFMLANLYQQDASASARAILISTIGSVLTLSVLVAWVNYANIV